MATVSVRYIVEDVDAAIAFYTRHLGSHEEMHPAPTFAMLSRGDLRLLLSAPSGAGGGGQAMPDGTRPEPGGWNRVSLEVSDLAAVVEELRKADGPLPQRDRYRSRRQADPARRPFRQPNRAVRTDPARGGPRSRSNATPGRRLKSAAIYPCAEGCDCVLFRSYFWKGGEDNVIELNTYHRIVVSAPAFVTVHAERRDGGLNPREALDWRRSG